MERITNNYLNDLNNSFLRVEFKHSKTLKSGESREGLDVVAYNTKGAKIYDLLSGGEQQIVNFAAGLALAHLHNITSSTLILDEPFTNLDEKNAENVVNFLMCHMKGKTILLISNEERLKSLIHDSIHVVKQKGVSYVN